MNRRLQQFLELEQLSPSRLADIMGIQRSGISHILSGRNKPGYEFLNRFLLKFPRINAEWLITGKGKPYKHNEEDMTINFDEQPESIDNIENIDNIDISPASYSTEREKISIKRVTIFFQDGSFDEFYPSK